MNTAKFQNSLARAQQLMLDDNFNRLVESKKSLAGGGRSGGGGGNDLAALEAQAFGYSSSQEYELVQPVQQIRQQGGNMLPQNIQESFRQTPPMSGNMMNNGMSSIMESLFPSSQPSVQQYGNGGVDYMLIKNIVEECIKRSGMINETTMRGFKIGEGNVVQFVDKKGNLYEGVLKLKKKAK